MRFEDETTYEGYAEFKTWVENKICVERGSEMRPESHKQIQRFRKENKTRDEISYFEELVPKIIKDERGVSGTNFAEEVEAQFKSFDTDGLKRASRRLFLKHALPKREEALQTQLGLSEPMPDYTYGLKEREFYTEDDPVLRRQPWGSTGYPSC